MRVAIHQPQYLPWLAYFDKAAQADLFVYLDDVQYQKGGVQNRNKIKTNTGEHWLTVPVGAKLGMLIKDVAVVENGWRLTHCKNIRQHYSQATADEELKKRICSAIESGPGLLADLAIHLSEIIFQALDIPCRRVRASELQVPGFKQDKVIAILEAVGATSYLSGKGAAAYQDPAVFSKHGIALHYHEYASVAYTQCYPSLGFIPDLSALDLVLNEGAKAKEKMMAGRPS